MPTEYQPSEHRIEAFYRAALIGLRYLDDQQDRASRFGADADARWNSFQGHLHTGDRINILCRDAAVTYGAAFAPSLIFDTDGVAPDEAFGPDWPGVEDRVAKKLWSNAEAAPRHDTTAAIEATADLLGLTAAPIEGDVTNLDASSSR